MKKTVREIKKRENAVIRINRLEVAGRQYIEIRQYYRTRHGDFEESTKGLTFLSGLAPDVIDGIRAAAVENL